MTTKECPNCQKAFVPSLRKDRWGNYLPHAQQLYCSQQCGRAASYATHMLKPEWRLSKLCSMAKNRAKEKGLLFDISPTYLMSLWESQGGRCAVSGRAFVLEAGSGRVHQDTVSVDRIVPELGYVKGNVRLVTYHVNVCLSEFGYSALVELMKDIQKKGHAA